MSAVILIVGDLMDYNWDMGYILEKYDILMVDNNVEAIDQIDTNLNIAMIILDLDRFGEDGFQVLTYLKTDRWHRDFPIIILTNVDRVEDEIRGLQLGAIDYLRKPIQVEDLKVRIDMHLTLVRAKSLGRRVKREDSLSDAGFAQAPIGMVIAHFPGLVYRCSYDREWTMQYVSDGCLGLTGYSPESLLYNRDISYNDIIVAEYREDIRNRWNYALAKGLQFEDEYQIITIEGKKKWVLEIGEGIYDERGMVEALEGIVLDISDRKEVEENLRYSNERDTWTGLHNRKCLEKILDRDARVKQGKGKRALISINLSMVQSLTIAYGFNYTQNLIKRVARELKLYCRDACTLFRTYENRFVFYLRDYRERYNLVKFCKDIAGILGTLLTIERINGGIGVLEMDKHDDADIDQLLKRLLIASEQSMKNSNREFDICFYDDKMEAQVIREEGIKRELHKIASDTEGEGLFLQYQPIVDLESNRICGFEALARIYSNELGLISPLEFIPIAERTKFIIPLGRKVFQKAFTFQNRLEKMGYGVINISINISVIELLAEGFANSLFQLIDEMQIDPKSVCIEITESVFSSNYGEINNILYRLRDFGIQIAIDDFGTGYSSLARGRELNVNCLKIDKHFVDKLLFIEPKRSITGDIISMAHKLGLIAVAEGVEQEEQRRYLLNYGCDRIQGYLISKPLDEGVAIELLKEGGYAYE